MKILLRIVSLLAIVWLGLLFTGYGVLTGSHKMPLALACSASI